MPTVHLSDEAYSRYQVLADSAGVSVAEWLENHVEKSSITMSSLLAKAVDTLPAMIYVFDLRLGYNTYINDFTADFFEMSLDEMQHQRRQFLIEALHPDDIELFLEYAVHWKTATDGDVFAKEYRLRRQNGDYRWFRSHESVLERNPDGTVAAIVGYAIDITENKEIGDAMRKSEARYRTLAEHFPDGLLALYDHDLRYTVVNGAGLTQLGLNADNLNGKRLRDFMPPDVYERDEPMLKAALEGDAQEKVVAYGDLYFHIVTAPVLDADGMVIGGMLLSQDITRLKQAEAKQRLRNEQLQLAIETAKIGIWERDIQSNVLSWSDRQLDIYGYTREEFDSQAVNWWDTVHPNDIDSVEERLSDIRENGELIDSHFRIYRHSDGKLRYVTASGRAIHNAQGELMKVVGINIDVTDIVQSRDDLAASEARYRALIQGAMNPITVYDEDANVMFLNDAARALIPSEYEVVVGQPLPHLTPEDIELIRKNNKHLLETRETKHVESSTEIDGKTYWFWSVMQPVFIEGRDVQEIQVITYDITEQKHAQVLEAERLRLQQELEKEHELAKQRQKILSILAHEIRTPLAIISTSSDILTKYYDKLTTDKRNKRITNIKTQIAHLEQMLDEISHLSQSFDGILTYEPEQTNLKALCKRVLTETRAIIGDKHKITAHIIPDDINAYIDEKLMYHALINLMTNAIKYSPNGGDIQLEIVDDMDTLKFIVKDEGIGIPTEDRNELFKPFSRASNVGQIRGTGLGLSIVAEVVDLHAGSVEVASTEGLGTTFTIHIPKRERKA